MPTKLERIAEIAKERPEDTFPKQVLPRPGHQAFQPIEDKLVQWALKEILEAIHEQDFLNCSLCGFKTTARVS